MKLKRVKNLFFLSCAKLPMPGKRWRPLFLKFGGVKVVDYKTVFVGRNVTVDTNRPYLITIDSGAYITHGCTILAHFFNPKEAAIHFDFGEVYIGKNAFIGCNSIICKSVTIGENAVIGAGSIINKDIPSNEIWGGCPIKFIKRRFKKC
jgi:UDP-2-acetamido-3-amino-2,3-dideoxy-glucuronate N-acetyltransferase